MDIAKFIDKIVARFIGTKHERDVKKLQPNVAAINARDQIKSLSDDELKARFLALKEQVQAPLKDADPTDSGFKEFEAGSSPRSFPRSLSFAKLAAARSTCAISTCS